ncbi:hypothetical protein [Acidiluteibacter ferrifornacis]|uniref:Uncharacterized protein n=1 Tax=Acidiluteibacter ferrifornacis TaxID=2692424 RepID=A0A6N9NF74_9FLAO|nr:hypothetical protein [Acidiluteibacter ferrifornacis]NBG64523.1 hypothetical protein [Acidiluteibacter ferrifornacis]
MATVDQIKNGLIDKILNIQNKEFLNALDKIISASFSVNQTELSDSQKAMLEMSNDDIIHGRTISQEAMNKRNLEWLNGQ